MGAFAYALVVVVMVVLIGISRMSGLNMAEKNSATASPFPTPSPTIPPTPTPEAKRGVSLSTNQNASDFIYPGATVKNSSDNSLSLESSDNPNAITNWYKNKIVSLNLNVTSFVTTNTNDNVNNSLVGANSQKEVRVEINKSSNQTATNISVQLS